MEAAMITAHSDTAGALVAMKRQTAAETNAFKPFEDNLDHLKALELEATLMLAVTYLRRNGAVDDDEDKYEPSFPEICRNKSLQDMVP